MSLLIHNRLAMRSGLSSLSCALAVAGACAMAVTWAGAGAQGADPAKLSLRQLPSGSTFVLVSQDESQPGSTSFTNQGKGQRGRGRGQRGPGQGQRGKMGQGPGMMAGNRADMMTIHALFANRDKIKRTVKELPNGVETLTESPDDAVAELLQEHVPAMDGRVKKNKPLPPMTFHPVFIELRKNAKKIDFKYQDTKHGIKVVYTSKDPYVVRIIQEHAKLVSRFLKNGMGEIHKPYKLPKR